jgi:hypothetical protein
MKHFACFADFFFVATPFFGATPLYRQLLDSLTFFEERRSGGEL